MTKTSTPEMGADARTRRRRISDTIPVVTGAEGPPSGTPRIRLNAPVTFLQPANTTGVALDATRAGMRVMVDAPLEPGQRCIAIVQLDNGEEMHERAEVLWSRRVDKGWMAALEFA